MSDAALNEAARPDERYRKSERLLKRSDFLRVQGQGARFSTPRIVVIAAPSALLVRRFGVTVSTKVGNAVVRNRVKRRLREIFRRNRAWWPEGYDFVVIARSEAARADFAVLYDDIERWSAWFSRRLSREAREALARPEAEGENSDPSSKG